MAYTLSTGRVVVESALPNGATFAEISDGTEMTDAEWAEYCAYVRNLTLEQSRERMLKRNPFHRYNA